MLRMLPKALPLFLLLSMAFGAGSVRAESSAPFLWEVKGAQTTHYLLGSVHLLPAAASQLPDGIADAYDAADGLVFESDIGALTSPKSALALLSAAKAPNGLKAEVDAAIYERLKTRIAKLGMPAPLCEPYKAWFCALTLEVFAYQKAGFSGEYGLDRQLYDIARADGKTLAWFEPPAQHLGLFMNMPEDLSRQFLAAALSEEGASGDEPQAMYRAWRDNDVSKIEALVTDMKARYPLVYERLLAARNRSWAAQLKRYLDGAHAQLIVVGAAHWLGPDGLLAQLKTAGYRVKPYIATDPELITRSPRQPVLITAAALSGTLARSR